MNRIAFSFALIAAGAFAACGGNDTPETTSAPQAEAAPKKAEAAAGHSHGTVEHALGEKLIGAWKAKASQMDDVVAGGETVFIVRLDGSAKPASVRLWVGDPTASNTVKILADPLEATSYHAHVASPDPLGANDMFWVELEPSGGAAARESFPLATGAVLPAQGPQTGFVVPLSGPAGPVGYAELKLHDDKGDLEIWLAKDNKMTSPLDVTADSVITVEFPQLSKSAQLRVRNTEKNEDENGKANLRDGKTNYFIFPGTSGADPAWLMGNFRSQAKITVPAPDGPYTSEAFTLVPHTHGPGGHTH